MGVGGDANGASRVMTEQGFGKGTGTGQELKCFS